MPTVAFFYGEDRTLTEIFGEDFNTGVPEGYHYEFVNPEALMTMLSVKNGKVVTPSGMSYRLLFVPPFVTRWTVPTLQKLSALVNAGAVIVAPRPMGGLGVQSSDAAIESIAKKLWGTADKPSSRGHAFGKGRVYAGVSLRQALVDDHVQPDVSFTRPESDTEILTLHRRTPDADIYFISNQRDRTEEIPMTFRVVGKRPELWHAENGHTELISYHSGADGTTVPMTLSPFEAVFSSLSPDHRSNRVDQASGKIDPAYKAVRPLDRNFPAGPRRSNFYSVGSFDVLDRFA